MCFILTGNVQFVASKKCSIINDMNWDVVEIAEAVNAFLHQRAQDDDLEQAVYGIDRLDELELHPLIQGALGRAGYGVWPEQRYPCDRTTRKKTTGQRCDIVLTPDNTPLMEPDAEATLFADDNAVALEAAYWLEIKTVAQFTVEGPFPRYSAELLQPVSKDIKKLAQDRLIFHAGLLLILFTVDAETAEHDLATWLDRCLERNLPVAAPITRDFQLTDRMGNAHVTTALFPVRRW